MTGYDRELVEHLVPAVWDKGAAWGMVDQYSPDPDMPKAAGLKNRGNTLWAHLADIRRAWSRTDLTETERQLVLLIGGMGFTVAEAARLLGGDRRRSGEAFDTAIGKMTDFLNGTATVPA